MTTYIAVYDSNVRRIRREFVIELPRIKGGTIKWANEIYEVSPSLSRTARFQVLFLIPL